MRLSDIDLRLLRVFKAVAEAGGFVKAQGALGISQPAISAQIARLEDRLAVRLCERGPQGFSLTAHGQEVLAETNRLLAHLDETAARLGRLGEQRTPQLRLGVVDCLLSDPQNPIVSAIRTVRGKNPDVKVSVGVYDLMDCLAELRANRLDISIVGVAADEEIPADLEMQHLYEEDSFLFCAPDHPCAGIDDPADLNAALAASDISAFSFIKNPIDDDLELMLFDANAEIPQANIESTAYLALAGTHVGLIPDHYGAELVKSGKLVKLASPAHQVTSHIRAVRSKSPTQSRVSNDFWAAVGWPVNQRRTSK